MTFLNKLNQKTLINIEISNPSKCPYIDDKIETKMFINLAEFPEKHDQLAVSGFRRVENYAYKPICQNCNACIPIRIIPQQISLTKSQKRCLNRNSNIRKLTSGLMSINIAMYKVFLKLGFKEEGKFRKVDLFEGKYTDHIYMGCFRNEFRRGDIK